MMRLIEFEIDFFLNKMNLIQSRDSLNNLYCVNQIFLIKYPLKYSLLDHRREKRIH